MSNKSPNSFGQLDEMSGRKTVDTFYLDLAKAFALVLHRHLLYKLQKYGVDGLQTDSLKLSWQIVDSAYQ